MNRKPQQWELERDRRVATAMQAAMHTQGVPVEIDRILRGWGLVMMAFAAHARGDEGEAISNQISAVTRWLDAQTKQEPMP